MTTTETPQVWAWRLLGALAAWCVCDSLSVLLCGAQVGGLTLWVKRTGDGTQYNDIAAVPSETVSQFKRRWLAQARLDLDPGLVSLHLVHRGPARLTKDPAERKAAEEAATVLDPSDTLAQAGVTDGSWLLAVVISQTAATEGELHDDLRSLSPRSVSLSHSPGVSLRAPMRLSRSL